MKDLKATVEWDRLDHVWEDVVTPPMREIYKAYRRPLGVGGKPAVIAIDLYNKVFQGGARPPHELQEEFPSSCGEYAHAAVEPIASVFATARGLGLPVIHMTASRSGSKAVATNRQSHLGEARTGEAWEFHPALAPVEGEIVIQKERASSFYGTQLVAELVMRNVDTLIVVGESTSGCVRASVVDGYSNGFHTVVVEDGVFDRSWLNHQINLFDLHHKYADVIPASVVTTLLTDAVNGAIA